MTSIYRELFIRCTKSPAAISDKVVTPSEKPQSKLLYKQALDAISVSIWIRRPFKAATGIILEPKNKPLSNCRFTLTVFFARGVVYGAVLVAAVSTV